MNIIDEFAFVYEIIDFIKIFSNKAVKVVFNKEMTSYNIDHLSEQALTEYEPGLLRKWEKIMNIFADYKTLLMISI